MVSLLSDIFKYSLGSMHIFNGWLLAVIVMSQTLVADTKPNVVFILADDLGWSDTTLFGTTNFYKTPNIERLAKRGMTFTRAYSSSPLCSPTRASILTGLSPARTGITTPNCHLPKVILEATAGDSASPIQMATQPSSVSRLNTKYYTLAEMFQDNGYATAHFGKWHLGPSPYSPLEHGFEIDVPHWHGPGPAGSYVAPWKFPDFDPNVPDEHLEDRMADEAVSFLERNQSQPFFLNYWMFSVHAPFDAKKSLIENYKKHVDPKDPQRSPTYAAMIESMDDAVGTLLDTLDRLNLAENTIIVFASDNGGNMYNEVDGTTATSNFPLRGGKATMYEGGVRGPAIVAYPNHVEANTRSDEVIQSCDFYPTLLDILKIAPQSNQEFDGISILPALNGEELNREAIFTYFPHSPGVPDWLPPAVSVHHDDWKLIRIFYGDNQEKHRFKLFNLKNDIGEANNVAGDHPDLVEKLDKLISAFLEETQAVTPKPNPKFDPAKYDLSREGKAALKGSRQAAKPKKSKPSKPVKGWVSGGTCTLSSQAGKLIVHSTGGDPYLSYRLPKQIDASPLTLKVTLTSNAAGQGQVFWHSAGINPPFHRDRSQTFKVIHNGKPHEYSIRLQSKHPAYAIRIDPATATGSIQILSFQLLNDQNEIVHEWN